MKKTLIVLLLMILTKITAFSSITYQEIKKDSTVLITTSDLKYTNLIFVEHKKLLIENALLYEQLNNLEDMHKQLIQIDSLKTEQYNILNNNYNVQINKLNSELNNKNQTIKYWKIGCFAISIGLLFILFK